MPRNQEVNVLLELMLTKGRAALMSGYRPTGWCLNAPERGREPTAPPITSRSASPAEPHMPNEVPI